MDPDSAAPLLRRSVRGVAHGIPAAEGKALSTSSTATCGRRCSMAWWVWPCWSGSRFSPCFVASPPFDRATVIEMPRRLARRCWHAWSPRSSTLQPRATTRRLYILFGLSVSYAVCCRNRVPETTAHRPCGRSTKSDELANPVSTSTVNDKFDEQVTVIRPRRGWIAINWRELWESRELLYFLMLRDIKVRYKQTVLGVAWAVLQPVMSMLVFTIIFGRLAKMPSEGFPYAIFVYTGLLPWTFFSTAVSTSSQSLVNQQALLTKIYLPRLFVPSAAIGSGIVDFAVSFAFFGCLMAYYGVAPGWGLLAVPGLVALTIIASLGVGLVLVCGDGDVPRLSLRHAVPDPGLDVSESGHLPGIDRSVRMAVAAGRQPHGRHHRRRFVRAPRTSVESDRVGDLDGLFRSPCLPMGSSISAAPRGASPMSPEHGPAIVVEGLGKVYQLSHRIDRHAIIARRVDGGGGGPVASISQPERQRRLDGGLLGRQGRVVRSSPRRGRRDRRPQRGRKEHVAEDAVADRRADRRIGDAARPRGVAARGRYRLSSRS